MQMTKTCSAMIESGKTYSHVCRLAIMPAYTCLEPMFDEKHSIQIKLIINN